MATIQCHVRIEQGLEQLGLQVNGGDCAEQVIGVGCQCEGANVGDGAGEVFRDKTTNTLNFRTIKAASPNVSVTLNGDVIEIDSLVGGGNVNGPNPSTLRAIATYANTTGTLLYNNTVVVDTAGTGPGGQLDFSAIRAADYGDPGQYRDLIQLARIPGNGEPGGLEVIVGDENIKASIQASEDPLIRVPTGRGKIIHEKISTFWNIEQEGSIILPTAPHTTGIIQYGVLGTNGAITTVYVGRITPVGSVSASPGSMYYLVDGVNSKTFQHRGAVANNTDWVELASSADTGKVEFTAINISGGTLAPLDVVYVKADGFATTKVDVASSDKLTPSRAVGVATSSIANSASGTILHFGLLILVDTSSWSQGDLLYLDPDNPGKLTNVRPLEGDWFVEVGKVLYAHPSEGAVFINPKVSDYPAEITPETGWPLGTLDELGYEFNNGTRELTIRRILGPMHNYQAGVKYFVGAEDGLNPGEYIDQITITDVEGVHFIHYDNGVITDSVNPTQSDIADLIRSKPLVAYLRWDATNSKSIYMGKEPHQFGLSRQSHLMWHFSLGAQWRGGLALNSILSEQSGDLDTHAQFGVDTGFLADEDLFHTRGNVGSTVGIPVVYLDGATSNDWARDDQNGFPVKSFVGGSGRLAWNEWTGAVWQQTEVDNGDFVLCHIFATNDYWDTIASDDGGHGLIAIQGQAEYDNVVGARNGAATEISNILNTVPTPESFPVATVIFQTSNGYANTPQARIREVESGVDYINWLGEGISPASPVSSHLNLADLNGGPDSDGGHTNMVIKPAAAVLDNIVARFDGDEKTLQGSGMRINDAGNVSTAFTDLVSVMGIESESTNGAAARIFVGNRDPNGNVTGNPGDTYRRVGGVNSRVYQHRGSASSNDDWVDMSAAGGGSLSGDWRFENTVGGAPASGRFRFNNATQSSATAIHIHDTNRGGSDWSNILSKLASGDVIYVQQADDGSKYHVLDVTGNAVDQTTYWQVPITVNTSGTDIDNLRDCALVFFFTGGGSGGGAPNIGFYGYRTGSNQTLSTGVETTVGMTNDRDDAGSDFTTGSTDSYFTCPTAGRYIFCGSLELTLAAAGRGETRLVSSVHGTVAESSDHENTAGTVKPCVSAALYCDAGEILRLRCWQNSGFTATIEQLYSHYSCAQIVEVT